MSHPELLEPVRAGRVVPRERVSKAPECMVARFVVSGLRVYIAERFQRRMQAAAHDIGRSDWLSVAGLENEPRFPVPDELLEKVRNSGV